MRELTIDLPSLELGQHSEIVSVNSVLTWQSFKVRTWQSLCKHRARRTKPAVSAQLDSSDGKPSLRNRMCASVYDVGAGGGGSKRAIAFPQPNHSTIQRALCPAEDYIRTPHFVYS